MKNKGRGVKVGRYYKFVLELRMKGGGSKGVIINLFRVQSYSFGN